MASSSAPAVLCPEIVGRTGEITTLRARIDGAARRRGGVVVIVGEAGAGKSRLVRETLAGRGGAVLSGRAVPSTQPVPYRPLTEALLTRFRSTPLPVAPELAGLGGLLGRLVPGWAGPAAGIDESPLLTSEAVVRLLALLGEPSGCVLVLEDLHWADAETLGAVDYFADTLREEPVLCVCTARPEGAAEELVDRLRRRDPASSLPVGPLTTADVDRMVASCLGTPTAPVELGRFVRDHSEGNPFFVEELLAGLVASGELAPDGEGWSCARELTPTVPASLSESIRRRLAGLDATSRRVVGAAALLGRRFSWELLPGIAEVDGRAVVDGLRAAVDGQLVETDGDEFVFRHALTREAVLGDLLPPDHRDLASRAWPALERAHPGLPGPFCELAAELAEAAGAPDESARRLLESARRALGDGAFTTAEATARRARRLAAGDGPVALEADELLVQVLADAGKPREALAIGGGLAERLEHAGRRADLRILLARAALSAGETDVAVRHLAAARAAGRPDRARLARLDAVASRVALEQARLDDAEALAHAALDAAADKPAVACEALGVLGRVARVVDMARSDAWFRQAADLAERHGLAGRHLEARRELALAAWGRGDVGPLSETRALANRYGALITVAVMDLSLADIALSSFDRAGCLAAAEACVEASRRYGLATESVAHLWLAGAHALAGDDEAMQAEIERALARDPDDPRILGDLHGRVLPTRAFVADDLPALRGHLDTMTEHVRVAPPGESIFPGRLLWATVATIDDPDVGAAARAEYARAAELMDLPMFLVAHDVMEAVALGRRGEFRAATDLAVRGLDELARLPLGQGMFHCQQVLVARAATRDGWGHPVAWLRESEAFFAAGGYDRTARRCRILLGEAGAPVPRRGRGESTVPPSLRAWGVTSREVDVLKLVAAGRSNKEIGERLFLSSKTVERHLSNLFDRTGVRSRGALGEVARRHGVVDA